MGATFGHVVLGHWVLMGATSGLVIHFLFESPHWGRPQASVGKASKKASRRSVISKLFNI